MKYIFPLLFLLVFGSAVHAQTSRHGIDIPICCGLDSPAYEYSGLAKWKGKILLIPQYPDKWENSIFAADSIDIDKAIAQKAKNGIPYTRIKFTNLDAIRQELKGTYQGFEGAVVLGNTIFFTLEFSEQTCYLLKGYIYTEKGQAGIVLQPPYAIAKPRNAYVNAGYESIGYAGGKDVAVFFEKNSDPKQASVWLVDTSFQQQPKPVLFTKPMYFRLTDVFAAGNNRFIGINHYFNDYRRKQKEFNYYVGVENMDAATRQMNGVSPADSNYTAIVELSLSGGHMSWRTRRLIGYGDENWEGLVPFKKGFLMVVDEYPKDKTPRMRYFEEKL